MTMPERAPSGAPSPQPNISQPQHGLAEDYAALEKTLCNTTIGRWFLAEHARRNRAPEIQLLLDAIARLEGAVLQPHHQTGSAGILAELLRMREAIGQLRRELAELNPLHRTDKHRGNATEALDQIVDAGDRATSDILSAAEDVQRASWSLRETGAPPEFCDRLDGRTVDIHLACVSQDIAGQKTAKVVHVLNDVDQRINAMIRVCSAEDNARAADDVETSTDDRNRAEDIERVRPGRPNLGEDPKPWTPDAMLSRATQTAPTVEQGEGTDLGGERFKRPEPLTLPRLNAIKRGALFG